MNGAKIILASLILWEVTVPGLAHDDGPSGARGRHQASGSGVPSMVIQSSGPYMVFAVAFSRDGKYLLSGGADRELKLWDAETGRELRTFHGHRGMVNSVAFSQDGRFALSGSNDKTAKIWDVATGKELLTFKGHDQEVVSVVFSPDGKHALSSSKYGGSLRFASLGDSGESGDTKLWEVATGKEVRTLTLPGGDAVGSFSVAFSPNGRYIATSEKGGNGRLWEASTGRLIREFEGRASAFYAVAFSPNARYVLAGGDDERLEMFDRETGATMWSYKGKGEGSIHSVAFSPDGKFVASGGIQSSEGRYIGKLDLWDATSGKHVRNLAGHRDWISAVTFSPDGRHLASGSDDKTIRFWEVATGREAKRIAGYTKGVSAIKVSLDGRYLLTGSGGAMEEILKQFVQPDDTPPVAAAGTITLWDISLGKVIRTFSVPAEPVLAVAFTPDNRHVISSSADHKISLWEIDSGREVSSLAVDAVTEDEEAFAATFSPDGRYAISVGSDANVTMLEVAGRKKVWQREGIGRADHQCVEFSPDGRHVVSATPSENLSLIEVETGKEVRQLAESASDCRAVAFTADGRRVLAGGETWLQIWDVATGEVVKTFDGLPDNVVYQSFSADGQFAILSRANRPSVIWDLNSGREHKTLSGSEVLTRIETFSPNGRRIFSGGEDGTVKIWDVGESGRTTSAAGQPPAAREICTLISFVDRTWAVVDPVGRYDAANGGNVEGLHWVVQNEPILLTQLKDRYYEPGLLAKLAGYDKNPLWEVNTFKDVALPPRVEYEVPTDGSSKLDIALSDRGGGIGPVSVLVNGKELVGDARARGQGRGAGRARLTVDLSRAPVIPGRPNTIQVKAWNEEGYLASRAVEKQWSPGGASGGQPPEVYIIAAGVSKYAAPGLLLQFAAKDAVDMAKTLTSGAKRLLGEDRVHLSLLTTAAAAGAIPPTKDNFRKVFDEARKARPQDVLIVYLAGHGLALREADGGDTYCYLTADARTTKLADRAVREATAITSEELTNWIKNIPALKQVMILDTCAAEAAAKRLVEGRNVPGEQIKAIERLSDRTGFHVLMGSAADEKSYETSQYGQGLLTYSLLFGLRGEALSGGEFIDISGLFQYAANKVPELAQSIGGIQRPHIATPRGGTSFVVGQLSAEDRAAIPLAVPYPLILPPLLINPASLYDDLRLTQALRDKLVEQSNAFLDNAGSPLQAFFVDADEMPGAILLSGSTRSKGRSLRLI
jgi:WD40 repeat protein